MKHSLSFIKYYFKTNQLVWSDELCGRAGGRACVCACAQCARAVGVHSVSVRSCSFHTILNIQFVFVFVPNLFVFWKLLNFVGFDFLFLFRVET